MMSSTCSVCVCVCVCVCVRARTCLLPIKTDDHILLLLVETSFMLFMSMGRGYVSELQSPTSLLFISQMTYEYGEQRWNYTGRGKTEELEGKPVPVPLWPPQIPRGLVRTLLH
jgi:hypothetical protein